MSRGCRPDAEANDEQTVHHLADAAVEAGGPGTVSERQAFCLNKRGQCPLVWSTLASPAGRVLFPHRRKQCDNLRNVARDSPLLFVLTLETCTMTPRERINCGFPGVTAQQCKERGCCFDDSIRGFPWCFKPLTIESQQEGTVTSSPLSVLGDEELVRRKSDT